MNFKKLTTSWIISSQYWEEPSPQIFLDLVTIHSWNLWKEQHKADLRSSLPKSLISCIIAMCLSSHSFKGCIFSLGLKHLTCSINSCLLSGLLHLLSKWLPKSANIFPKDFCDNPVVHWATYSLMHLIPPFILLFNHKIKYKYLMPVFNEHF